MESTAKWLKRGLSVSVLVLLLGSVLAGTSENINAQLLRLGVSLWDNYFMLRGERPDPGCDPSIPIETRLDQLEKEFKNSNSAIDDLLAEPFDRDAARISLVGQNRVCEEKHRLATAYDAEHNVWVQTYALIESSFAKISIFSIKHQRTMLIVLLMLCAAYATWKQEHIAFRGITTRTEHILSNAFQGLAAFSLFYSTYRFKADADAAGAELTSPHLLTILMLGSLAVVAVTVLKLAQARQLPNDATKPFRALLTIPIQTWMLLVAAYHFFIAQSHPAGISMYFTQIFQLTNLHLAIGLYIWTGMLLKESMVGARLFAVFKPWNLPPELLAVLAIALMALPTAYTGASGIIIIAMGAVVYQELRRVGTRRQLALAVTAMTGSSGVVLRPCLLVVGIAILNKEVLSDDLFYWGTRVFMLTLLVFAIFALLLKREPFRIAPVAEALGPSAQRLMALWPYILICGSLMLVYAWLLDAYLDEFSAPIILPVIMFAFILYERCFSKHDRSEATVENSDPYTVRSAFSKAVGNSSVQIGALLMLMACSFTIGGVLERNGSGLAIPEGFDSVYLTMGVLVLFLVFVGMVMDPFGALILVTGLVAPLAYEHGIDPIHFWMTCLVAFELGYLSPPVSLNHLLTRQVVGSREVDIAMSEGDTFYYRHERILLPLMVMATTLVIVAYGPFLFYE